MTQIDTRAVLDGGSVAAMIAVPVQIIARIAVDDNKQSGSTVLVTMVILGALVLGAGVAAWRQQRRTPLTHGIITAVGVYVSIQVVFTTLKALQGDPIRWGRIITSFTLSLVAGILGGMLGSILLRQGVRSQR